jgi:hypothetical protein
MASLLELFLEQEANAQVARVLGEAAQLEHGVRYFAFNRFNVRLDLDSRTATIEDELDPESEVALPLADLLARLPEP